MTILLLSLAGGVGTLLRFIIDGLIRTLFGRSFPWGTFIINISGSFLLGVITGLVMHQHAPETIRLILGVGFCGGYTTFSTASFETVRLVEERRYVAAFMNVGGTLVLTLVGAALGMLLVQ